MLQVIFLCQRNTGPTLYFFPALNNKQTNTDKQKYGVFNLSITEKEKHQSLSTKALKMVFLKNLKSFCILDYNVSNPRNKKKNLKSIKG